MKRYLAWMLAALFALLPVAGLTAENCDTQISTTLPEKHTIMVLCGVGGALRVDGTVYTGIREFFVERLSAFELEVVPDTGYRFSQVQAQPSAGVSIEGNTITIASVYEDKQLTLYFVAEQNPTPTPTATPTASPTATPTASPTATPAASPAPVPHFDLPYVQSQNNVLYDEYLGTGSGLAELGIVYGGTYSLDKYELLAVLQGEDQAAERAEENLLLVIAQPEEDGTYGQRSLMLSGLQLARLWQEKNFEWLELRDGEAGVLLRMEELLSGSVAKYVDCALADPEAAEPEAAENLPEVELTASQLERIQFEVRIVPGEEGAYCFGVYAWLAGEQLPIAELTPSLKVSLNAGEQGDEAARSAYAETHALSATDETGAVQSLESTLIQTPVRQMDEQNQSGEYFNVKIDPEENAIVLYDSQKPLEAYRRWSLCADWAGDAEYRLVALGS